MARSIALALVSGALFLLPSSAALAQRPAEEAAALLRTSPPEHR